MAHYGLERHDTNSIELDFYLVVSRGDNSFARPGVRVTAGYPNLSRRERALRLKVSLPMALFEAPQIEATIKVASPEQRVSIDADAIAEVVEQAIGMNVDLQVVSPTSEE